ncbi:SDR family oxidoreductase [Chryseolinea lacunae]|uniref:SDR family oxidoreductase n=1 Tax=Chryseolinea lacunae TaxID=2801331 RepID=A0ABS1L1B3_9BACT|nr:SDR family oxidoreductase [Chryseolinea lacunae]MBL0745499.1 SDR family oxidoreductase [Chryseolinea lacunae]
MILITGATGHFGKATIDFLLQKGVDKKNIVALVRDTAKASALPGIATRVGDFNDKASLSAAFKGVDTLLFVSSGTLVDRVQQHKNVVDAAKENHVKHIVYTSALKAASAMKFTPGIDHYETEEFLKTSGIAYTVLRNTFYAEVLPMLLGDALTSGDLYYPAGNATVNLASRTDMAEAAAVVLQNPAAHVNTIYEITAARSISFAELAALLSAAVGKTITYHSITLDAMKDGLVKAGVPEIYVPMMLGVADAIGSNEFSYADNSLEKLIGRTPTALKDLLPGILKQKGE